MQWNGKCIQFEISLFPIIIIIIIMAWFALFVCASTSYINQDAVTSPQSHSIQSKPPSDRIFNFNENENCIVQPYFLCCVIHFHLCAVADGCICISCPAPPPQLLYFFMHFKIIIRERMRWWCCCWRLLGMTRSVLFVNIHAPTLRIREKPSMRRIICCDVSGVEKILSSIFHSLDGWKTL